MDRVGQVLHPPLAEVDEGERDPVRHRLLHIARDADRAGSGELLQPGGHIHAVAQEIAVTLDDVADRDPDAEMHLPRGGMGHVARAERVLDVDGAAGRFDGAGELAHHAVPGAAEDAPARPGDEIVEDHAIGFEARKRLFLILGGEARVFRHIRGEDGRDLSLERRSA